MFFQSFEMNFAANELPFMNIKIVKQITERRKNSDDDDYDDDNR